MLVQLLIGMAVIAGTVALHAGFMASGLHLYQEHGAEWRSAGGKAGVIILVVLWFFFSIVLMCWGWALLFLGLGALATLEEALYFATVTFTTLGYGDVVLGPDWRLLGAFASANGTIIIGWTTALVFVVVQQVYFDQEG
jgi:hypothetical protein